MDEKLKELLDKARQGGASKEQLQGIVDSYKTKSESVPKGVTAEGSGESVSTSASTDSLSDSKGTRTLVEKIDAGEIDTTYNPDPNNILGNLPDGGLAFKEEASKKLEGFYKAAGVEDYTIDDTTITHEALRIKDNLEKEEEAKQKWEDWDFWSESWKKVKANTNRAIGGLAGLPNYMNKTIFTLTADDEAIEYANSLDPKMREVFINSIMYNPINNPIGAMGQASAEGQEDFLKKAEAIEADMIQLDGYITDDFGSGEYGKGTLRVLSEGIGSIPSLVQAMVPYVGLTSIAAGSAANKQEELESEGYGLGLDTTFNAAINGTAEALSEVYTRRLGSKLFRSLRGATPAGRTTVFETIKENLMVAPLYEGGSEAATSLVQNLSDKYVQGKEKEFNDIWKEVSDSFLIGFGVGKGIGTATYVTQTSRSLVEDINTQKVLKSDTNDFNTLKDAFNPDLPNSYSLDQLKLANYGSNNNRLARELEKEVKAGEMTQEQASAYQHKYNETVSALKKTQGVKMTDDKRVEAVNIVAEKEQLQREVKNMDEALATSKKEKIKALDEKLIEISTGKKPDTDAKTEPKKESTKVKEEAVSKEGETDTKAEQTEQEVVERTEGVDIKDSPKGTFINVGLLEGTTENEITVEEVQSHLPKDVEVIQSEVIDGTEKTASIELSRPLTDLEMKDFLAATKQNAIPQITEGNGVMFGTKEGGEFNPEFFVMPDNVSLKDKLNEQNKTEPDVGTPEGAETEGDGGIQQEGTDSSDAGDVQADGKDIKEKAKEVAAKIRKAKFNSSAKEAMSKLKSTPTGVFEVAWDGAVETVATTIEVTGDIALGVQKGLAQLKRTKWYQGLSDNGKKMAERKFNDFFRDEIKLSDVDKKQSKASKVLQSTGQKFVDVFTNINAAIKDLEGAKEFYKKQGLFESKSAHKVTSMLEGITKAVKTISKSKNTVQQVSDYMYAKHALERNKHVLENVDEENPFGSGLTDSEANFIIDQYDDSEKADLEKLSKPFYDLIDDSRNIMVETGLMSQEAMDNLTSTNDTYVPLTGFADEQIELGAQIVQGKAVTVKGKEFRGVTGRTTEAGNIISNIIKQYTDVAIRGSKNEMLQEFDNIKKSNDPDALPYKVYTKETLPKSKGLNTKGKVSHAKAPAQIDETYVGFKVNGQQKYVKFNNPVLAQNLNRSTDAVIDGFTKTAGRLNRFLSASFTQYNPSFMIPNFFRDLQTGLINLKAQADLNEDLDGKDLSDKAAKGVLKAIKTIHADERGGTPKGKFADYYQEFKEEGAKTGWANKMSLNDITQKVHHMEKLFSTTHTFDKTTVQRGWNAFKSIVDNANTAIENGIRLSTYVAARDAGVSKLDAASLAKELTINFNRRGEIGGLMNTLYLFFNASVQGVNTFAKNMLTFKTYTDSKGNTKKTLNRGQKAALAVQIISGVLTMYNIAASEDDEESGLSVYDSIPDYEKERNLIIMKPSGKDYFKIPLPYGYNIFSNLGTMAAEVAFGSRDIEDAVDFTLGSIVGSYLPFSTPEGDFLRKTSYSATPTIFTPMFMLAENKDFFGGQIYRENFPTSKDKLATSHLGSKNTPEWYKKSSVLLNSVSGGNKFEEGALNFHPDKAEFLVDYFGGGALKFMKDTYGVAEKGAYIASGTDISIDPRRVPLLNKVYGKDTHFPEMNIFYTVQENYKRKLNHLKSSKEDPKEKVALMRLDALYKVTDKKLKLIRAKEKSVLELDDTSKKLEGLEQIELKKKKVYSEHVKKYLKLKKTLKGDYE